MITLSNGHEIKYMVASGALGFDGKSYPHEWPLRWIGLIDPSLFTVVAKTVTYKPRKGNLRWYKPWGCIRLLPGGVVNAVELTIKGLGGGAKKKVFLQTKERSLWLAQFFLIITTSLLRWQR